MIYDDAMTINAINQADSTFPNEDLETRTTGNSIEAKKSQKEKYQAVNLYGWMKKVFRPTALVALVAAVVLAGCGHGVLSRVIKKVSTSTTSGSTAAVPSLQFPKGGWPGSPVTAMRVIVPSEAARGSFGPDGRIAYSKLDHVVNGTRYGDIYVASATGSGARCITCNNPRVPHLSNDVPVWDPNGQYIVYEGQNPSLGSAPSRLTQGGAGFNNDLWAITPGGHHAYRLTNTMRGEAVLHPQFSLNGTQLAWAAYDHVPGGLLERRGQWNIHVASFAITAHGPALENVHVYRPGQATTTTFYETHGFTSTGMLVFSSNMDSPYESSCRGCALGIWKWRPGSSSPPVLLTPNTSAWNEHAAINPRTGNIAWITSQGEPFIPSNDWGATLRTDWWIMGPNGGGKQRLTFFNSPGSRQRVICAEGSWNPSGNELLAAVEVFNGTASNSELVELSIGT
jgi:Tol biopolymer transport system component